MRQFFCILCDAPFFKKNSLFCDHCLHSFIKHQGLKLRFDKGVPHHYLFSWSKKNDSLCRRLAYFLKRKPSTHFLELASIMNLPKKCLLSETLVVPRAHESKRLNHAQSLAEALMKLYSFQSVISLYTRQIGPQKRKKSRKERLEGPEESEILSGVLVEKGEWVFVDDVLVTGATCYKISRRLGSKPGQIITLFYKEKEF